MIDIPLSRDMVALIDEIDIERIADFNWCVRTGSTTLYAVRRIEGKVQYMHRIILGLTLGDHRVVHHLNYDGLDNRRCNLQICTHAENDRTPHRRKKFYGVYSTPAGRWQARIKRSPTFHYLGTFGTKQEARVAVQKFLDGEPKFKKVRGCWKVHIEGMCTPWATRLTQGDARLYARQFRQNGVMATAQWI